jgi:D-amino-acid dehydrogenase
MKIIVLGSGLLGVTTAYELGKRGAEVIVLDRQPVSGAECSYSNGAQLSYTHSEPWASPSTLPKAIKWMFRDDAPLVLRPRADWQMIRWTMKFLRNCTNARAQANCINILRLGLYSREKMAEIARDTGIQFDYTTTGIVHIFEKEKDYDAAKRQSEFQAKFGGDFRVITRDECLAREPSLAHTPRTIIGGMHAFRDECGDAYKYCQELAKVAASRHGVKFLYGVNIKKLVAQGEKIVAVKTDQGDMTADGYVMAMGSYSSMQLRKIGIDIPVYPMKGYSITINANEFCPQGSVTDGSYKVVYTRLGDKLRVAGTAEFAGYNDSIKEKRITPIVQATQATFPKADWSQEIKKWACLRPSTPDGPPIMGKTPYQNLFLNTGHGTLGWAQVAGSGALVADIMEGKTPGIMMQGLTMEGR